MAAHDASRADAGGEEGALVSVTTSRLRGEAVARIVDFVERVVAEECARRAARIAERAEVREARRRRKEEGGEEEGEEEGEVEEEDDEDEDVEDDDVGLGEARGKAQSVEAHFYDGFTLDGGLRGASETGASTAIEYDVQGLGGIRFADEDASQACFNCGEAGHPSRACPHPRNDQLAEMRRKAYEQILGRSFGAPASGGAERYHEEGGASRFGNPVAGALSAELRNALGMEPLDPPPYLARFLRQGYPVGHLAERDEEVTQASGLRIFTGDEKEDEEDGGGGDADGDADELMDDVEWPINFPGVNAPLPAGADVARWSRAAAYDYASRGPPELPLREPIPLP